MNFLSDARSVFIIGIKGVAMANLAVTLRQMGKTVTGSDIEEGFITDKLLFKQNIEWRVGFDKKALPEGIDLVIYSAAHKGIENPQIIEARKKGIKIASQAEILGELLNQFKTKIAICGSHGKTTTSSLLSYALIKLGKNPSYLIGAPSFNDYDGSTYKKSDYFVIEADEYGVNPPKDKTPKFHFLNPNHIICTNIDFDHPDVYNDIDDVRAAFLTFFAEKKLILCVDDPIIAQSLNQLDRNHYQTYGYSKNPDFTIKKARVDHINSSFELWNKGKCLGRFDISLFGKKNISNAASVIVLLLNLGFTADKIKKAITGFTGAKRRFEKVFFSNNIYLFDDYAHHPQEIATTITAAKERFRRRRIIVIFQPHTYSRTQSLLDKFALSLSLADCSFILPIFPSAREDKNKFTVRSEDIVKLADDNNLIAVKNTGDLMKKLATTLRSGDIVFTMGAGDVYKLKDHINSIIAHTT